jgi:glycosyltransferase involved in cell wall biosynthesis
MEPVLDISIVVPVRFAETTIAQTLGALLEQCEGRAAEVVAVVSSKDPALEVLRRLAPGPRLRLLEMPGRKSVPQLRAEGVRAARGRLVAITEDHCLFSEGWVEGLIRGHQTRDIAAIGGPVENGRTGSLLDWAIYFSRYLGSMPPVALGSTGSLPGNNACYRREVLQDLARLYSDGFWEHDFNRELRAYGYVLWQDPGLVVTHNKLYRFGPYLALRYRHARCFGGMIARPLSFGGRMRRALLSPLLLLLLPLRAIRTLRAKRRRGHEFLLSFPALLLCYGIWFGGELAGYLGGPGQTCSETD